jgi:hypothetical protein
MIIAVIDRRRLDLTREYRHLEVFSGWVESRCEPSGGDR